MARIRKIQGSEKPIQKKIVWYIALYIRLSKDDGNDESFSVTNQKKVLAEYVENFFQGKYVIADYYNDRFAYVTSSNVRRTFDTKRRSGEFIGAFAPYGYVKNPSDKNALIIDEEAALVVRNIFQWFVYGDGSTEIVTDEKGTERETLRGSMSKEGIARKLNEMGIPNASFETS